MRKCEICPYEKQGRITKSGKEGLPTRWTHIGGVLLCRQCQEMVIRMNKQMSRRAFGYVRASTTKQDMSIEIQQEVIREYCRVRKLELVDFFIDKASAAKVKFVGRKAGRQVYVSAMEGDHIVMAKYDRGFRDVVDCLTMFERWKRQNIHIHFAAQGGLLPPTPQGKFMLTLMVAVAEQESSSIGSRQRETKRKRRHDLRPMMPNQMVLGFMAWWPDEKKVLSEKRMVLIPAEYENSKIFYNWYYKKGMSHRQITHKAELEGIRVPPEARAQDDRIHELYSRERMRRLIILQEELRETEKIEKNYDMTLRELGDAWQRHFYATGRSRVPKKQTQFHARKKQQMAETTAGDVDDIWDENGEATD